MVAGASAVYLWKGSATADRLALASAEVGVLFCTLVLVTGPIWARPIWGVWWTWDPRLTMTVILWAIYASYLMLRAFGGEDDAVRRYAAVLGIVGVLDIPLIRVSVRLLHGIHPVGHHADRQGGRARPDDARGALRVVGGHPPPRDLADRVPRARGARLADEMAALRREVLGGEGVA